MLVFLHFPSKTVSFFIFRALKKYIKKNILFGLIPDLNKSYYSCVRLTMAGFTPASPCRLGFTRYYSGQIRVNEKKEWREKGKIGNGREREDKDKEYKTRGWIDSWAHIRKIMKISKDNWMTGRLNPRQEWKKEKRKRGKEERVMRWKTRWRAGAKSGNIHLFSSEGYSVPLG